MFDKNPYMVIIAGENFMVILIVNDFFVVESDLRV